MDLEYLNRYLLYKRKRAEAAELLDSLMQSAAPASPKLSDMPKGTDTSDKVSTLAIEMADLSERLRFYNKEIAEMRPEIVNFISAIEDDQTRTVFRLRFLKGMTWARIADILKDVSDDAPRKKCVRYISGFTE